MKRAGAIAIALMLAIALASLPACGKRAKPGKYYGVSADWCYDHGGRFAPKVWPQISTICVIE